MTLQRLSWLPKALLMVGFPLASAGCESFMNKMTVDSTAPVLKLGSASFDSESDVQLARDALPAQIKTIDGILVAGPENRTLLELTALSYVQYAFAFLEDDLEALSPGAATGGVVLNWTF